MLTKNKFNEYDLLGVKVHAATMLQAITAIVETAGDPKSASCYVVKPYVEFLDRAADDPDAKQLLNDSALSLPDGVALQWAAAVLHGAHKPSRARFWLLTACIVLFPAMIRKPLPEKFSGVNFTWPMLARCRDAHLKIFLIGSPKNRHITDIEKRIEDVLPGIEIVGAIPGEVDGMSGKALYEHLKKQGPSKEFINQIKDVQPDIVLVGMGFPLQERLMAWLIKDIPHGVFIGEGGTFDYASFGGAVRRAPRIFQVTGLEWFWRLVLEPTRIKRQMAIPRFMKRVYNEAFHKF